MPTDTGIDDLVLLGHHWDVCQGQDKQVLLFLVELEDAICPTHSSGESARGHPGRRFLHTASPFHLHGLGLRQDGDLWTSARCTCPTLQSCLRPSPLRFASGVLRPAFFAQEGETRVSISL